MNTIRISKIDAARRQLDSSIRLWFADDDPVTIHALAWAAYQIVQDINEKKGDTSISLIELMRKIIKAEHIEESMGRFKEAMTFFKHANRDPHAILEFNPQQNDAIILFAIRGLQLLGEHITDVMRAYYFWNNLHSPSYFLKQEDGKGVPPNMVAQLRNIPKSDFLKAALLGFAQNKGVR